MMPKWGEPEYVLGLLTAYNMCLPLPKRVVEFGALAGACITRPFLARNKDWEGIWIEPGPGYSQVKRIADELGNVEAHNCAVATYDGEITFHTHVTRPGASSIIPNKNRKAKLANQYKGKTRTNTVPCKRLKTLLAGRKVGLMIIDVEEYEVPIVTDMLDTDIYPAVIIVEFSSAAARKQQRELLRRRYQLLRMLLGPNNDVYIRQDVAKAAREQQCQIRF